MPAPTDVNPKTGQMYAVNPATGQYDDNYWANVGRFEAGGGGVDFNQVPSALEFAQKLGGGEEKALSDIVMQMRTREQPLDIYGRLETEAGVPELRASSKTLSKEIASIEDYLDQIEPDITARTRESLVTEAQRRGMLGAEREPWLQKLSKLGTSLGRVQAGLSEAMQGVSTKTQLALQGQEMDIEPLKLQYTALVDRNARLMTGFTADRQTQVDFYFNKLARQHQLEDREWQELNQLSQEERQYTRQLETAAAEAGVKLTGAETNDEVLALIGSAAAEKIAFDRKVALRGTEGERTATAARSQLSRDVASGMYHRDLVQLYKDKLPMYEITAAYNAGPAAKTWGPANLQDIIREPLTEYQKRSLELKKEDKEDVDPRAYVMDALRQGLPLRQ